ncbi:unnamed protein product [Colias eurytheme]|nr:unnamed protein product [Colias eurytheme]
MSFKLWLALACILLYRCNGNRHVRKFPEGFLFGTSTASYQTEGAWNEDGKSESIWDHMSHQLPCSIKHCDTGDIGDDSYHLYKRDVEMIRELGLDFYRFSLSWSRILPTGFPDVINEAGVQYYNNLINELLKYNIIPMVTIYHFDLPQTLQKLGGWSNPHIVDWFGDFSQIVFKLFGDRVKYWVTINEPYYICYEGYGADSMAPQVNVTGIAEYLCAKNVLVAHAKAYHIYDEEFRPTQGGKIFISINARWNEPDGDDNVEAADDANQFFIMQYAYPIFSKSGDFPSSIKKIIAAKSKEQGFLRSRLPEFTPEEIEYVRGTSDLYGLNHYSTQLIYRNESVKGFYKIPSMYDDTGVLIYQLDKWLLSNSSITKAVPWGFHKLLTYIKEKFDNPPIFVTENGFGGSTGLEDNDRITYYRLYLSVLLDAIENGSDIRGYTAWSLMDNFEWNQGYSIRFGLYEVNYTCPNRTRTPRKSAYVYKEIARTHKLDFEFEPNTSVPISALGEDGDESH